MGKNGRFPIKTTHTLTAAETPTAVSTKIAMVEIKYGETAVSQSKHPVPSP